MKKLLVVVSLLCSSMSWAQLSSQEKIQDFQTLASLYAKQYAPYTWKKQLLNYDLFNIKPWIDKINSTTDDLGFYEVMLEYVASLNDIHSSYFTPSDFVADLRFRIDIYDGKFLIDRIDRTALPSVKFPFQIGDELVMVDNRTPDDYIQEFSPLLAFANPISQRRFLAIYVTVRAQDTIPRSEEVGETATVVIRRQSGNLETYMIPWVKSGTPLTQVGPVPLPQNTLHADTAQKGDAKARDSKYYLHPLRYLANNTMPDGRKRFLRNFDGRSPIFQLPASFVQRLGKDVTDFFFTGTYKAGDKTIGFIRINDFEVGGDFNNTQPAEQQFDDEITFLEKNTDGLVIDIMRNPGGFGCYAEDLMSRLATQPFHGLSLQFRPDLADVQEFNQAVLDLEDFGFGWELTVAKEQQRQINKAYASSRGMTPQLAVCSYYSKRPPNKDANGKLAIYDKPVLLLTDEFSISAADFFASFFQDAQRGKNFGMRTSGAGGSIVSYPIVGYYSEGSASVTRTLGIRAHPIVTPDYPTAPLIENIGVRPEIVNDYQTKDNLLNNGKTFVDAFTKAIVDMIK